MIVFGGLSKVQGADTTDPASSSAIQILSMCRNRKVIVELVDVQKAIDSVIAAAVELAMLTAIAVR